MPPSSRRRFLLACAGLGASAGGLWLSRSSTRPLQRVQRSAHGFGTTVSITALHADAERAAAAIEAALAELATVESVMSLYRPDSQLCRLNERRRLANPHPYLVRVLRHAAATSQRTGGAFDITVQPLWELYASASREQRIPSPQEIATAQASVDWRRVEVADDFVALHGASTKVTLNGIAQGFAADRALAALRDHGIEHALVDTGELAADGTNRSRDAWTAGVQHPRADDAFAALVPLDGRALATSGDYATTFTPDRKHHHLLDPRSGVSPCELASVSILAPTALEADALSTACFVLGPERALRLVASLPDVDALLITPDGRALTTSGFPSAA